MGAGWGRAFVRGFLAFLIVALLAQATAFVTTLANPEADLLTVLRTGGVLYFFFHHVGIDVQLPDIRVPETQDSPFAGALSLEVTIALALMLGTVVAIWLMYRAGRAVANDGGGSLGARLLHGAKPALVYALLSLGASFMIAFFVPIPPLPFAGSEDQVRVGVSPVAAFVWPFVIALIPALLGGAASARDVVAPTPGMRRATGAVSGGWRMLWLALVFALIGYLVTAYSNPDVPLPLGPRWSEALAGAGSSAEMVNLIVLTVLIVPNLAVLTLVPALGGALGAYGGGISCDLLSYTRFPVGPAEPGSGGASLDACAQLPIALETAPVVFLAFLLVPLVATVLGGRRAARRSGALGTGEGAAVGALAGIPFALLMVGLMVLATITWSVQGAPLPAGGTFIIGPGLVLGAMLALAWGVAGGSLGGAMAGSRARLAPPPPRGGTPPVPGPPPGPPAPAAATTAGVSEPASSGASPAGVPVGGSSAAPSAATIDVPGPSPAQGQVGASAPRGKPPKEKPQKPPRAPKPAKRPKPQRRGKVTGFEPRFPKPPEPQA